MFMKKTLIYVSVALVVILVLWHYSHMPSVVDATSDTATNVSKQLSPKVVSQPPNRPSTKQLPFTSGRRASIFRNLLKENMGFKELTSLEESKQSKLLDFLEVLSLKVEKLQQVNRVLDLDSREEIHFHIQKYSDVELDSLLTGLGEIIGEETAKKFLDSDLNPKVRRWFLGFGRQETSFKVKFRPNGEPNLCVQSGDYTWEYRGNDFPSYYKHLVNFEPRD